MARLLADFAGGERPFRAFEHCAQNELLFGHVAHQQERLRRDNLIINPQISLDGYGEFQFQDRKNLRPSESRGIRKLGVRGSAILDPESSLTLGDRPG